ncbi:glutamine--fructose-6-phosphate transaminase (isomerizing) [Ectothiorhodospiraceae bacterium BW-2]|nr:glutamine--fructose-6-phosphate transaminase (isomerizing) [Ectothiorhodospiraceae bacterium BW-2]
MCGIVGYIGTEEATTLLLSGLRELEYRGYDSAGMALNETDGMRNFRAVGKLDNLLQKVGDYRTQGAVAAIGHTRWATHGKPTEMNAHPHRLTHSAVVHNGIIENYTQLRQQVSTGFSSQTDSEVIVHLFEHHLQQGAEPLSAFRAVLNRLEGAYAILLTTEQAPEKIFFAKQGSPLQVGFNNGCHFASSDAAMLDRCGAATYLEDGEWGYATATELQLFDREESPITPTIHPLPASSLSAQKEGFRFFMEKEIYEQSEVVNSVLMGRLSHQVALEELAPEWLQPFSSVTICACGTSYHAALTASYLLERLCRLPTHVAIASEFRYRQPVLDPNGLFIVISQSGETADTLEALKLVKRDRIATLALCNVDNSSMVREADRAILLRAGIEKGVASTKAFSAQVVTLWLLALYWGQIRATLTPEQLTTEIEAMRQIHRVMEVQPSVHDRLTRLSKRYLHGHGFFFIGRDIFYPLALEGALKLKEISYLHAEGYPAGEMKHGPIALADAELFTIALMGRSLLYDKISSNVEELSARDSTIIAISTDYVELADDLIQIRPYNHPMLEFFEMLVVVQLLSMEIAIRLGNDVDMPRNLAKSVTVE